MDERHQPADCGSKVAERILFFFQVKFYVAFFSFVGSSTVARFFFLGCRRSDDRRTLRTRANLQSHSHGICFFCFFLTGSLLKLYARFSSSDFSFLRLILLFYFFFCVEGILVSFLVLLPRRTN